jgi:sugar-specific transcriptional regulator TrmB
MDNLKQILDNFSFSEQESDIYLASLKLGKAGAKEIARKADMSRTSAYFHIEKLVDRGVLREIKGEDKTYFTAKPPENIAEELQKKVTDFKSIVPKLESLKETEKEVPEVSVDESRTQYEQVYDEISSLPRNSEFRVIEGREAMIHEIKSLHDKKWEKFFNRIKERKIETRALFTKEGLETAKEKLSPENIRNIKKREWLLKTLPEKKLPFDELIYIYANKVVFLFPRVSLIFTIKHRRIARAFKSIFDSLYNFAKSRPNPWN